MITLENNTADEAGSAVYGGRIDSCYLYTSSQQNTHRNVFDAIFKILDFPLSLVSQVSSSPSSVHVCNHGMSDSLEIAGCETYQV